MNTPARILLAQDSLTVSGVLESCLENEGYQVRLAGSIADALGSIKSEGLPEILLLDVNLPDIQGDHACARLRKSAATRNSVIVLVSALARTRLAELAYQADADAFFHKEQPVEVLLAWLEAHLPVLRELAGQERLHPVRDAGLPEGKDVVLVYPDSGPRKAITTVLEQDGFRVRAAQDLAGSARLLRERRPAGVVLDVGIPGAGPELACAVWRMRPGLEELPVLLLFPEEIEDPARVAFDAGAQGWLQRPCSASDLRVRLGALVRGERQAPGEPPPSEEERQRFRRLAKEFGSPDPSARLAAVRALTARVDPALLPGLCAMLDDEQGEVRRAVLQALARVRGGEVVRAVSRCLAPERPREERLAAARALEEMGDESAQDDLQGLLFEEDPELEQLARRALERIEQRRN